MKRQRAPTNWRLSDMTLVVLAMMCVLVGVIIIVMLFASSYRVHAAGPTTTSNPPASNSVVEFSASSYPALELLASAVIKVNRIGDLSAPASVDYATSDVTASNKSDYIAAYGTLRFAPGEESKNFSVLINMDSYAEGSETFNVTLSNPSGASLGASMATVNIYDIQYGGQTNPVDNPYVFVAQHYRDFLNRESDTDGANFWRGEITGCGTDQSCVEIKRINVSAAFFQSIEFQETGYLVERMYKAGYGDRVGTSTWNGTHQMPVPAIRIEEFLRDTQQISKGLVVNQPGWQTVLENNKRSFAEDFVERPEFYSRFPDSMTPAQFVDALNQNAGNILSSEERTAAIARFAGDADIHNAAICAQVLRQVAEAEDFKTREFNRAFVLMQYFGYLKRNPNDGPDGDYTGYDFWLTKLNHFNGNFIEAEMVKAFLTSNEYRQRFGPN